MGANYIAESFEGLAQEFEEVLEWMRCVGVEFPSTRVAHYRRSTRELLRVIDQADEEAGNKHFADFVNTLFEAHELKLIHKGFSRGGDELYLRRQLDQLHG